ncbi:hypothetical protein KEJ15_03730 [Candidatus Bathyarchaeota archaeon]|nr:hypothetical protein [Candidatus Bathyarchaeota archaeon]
MAGEAYICHVIIPLRDRLKSKDFYQKVFGWVVEERPGTFILDLLPPSGKGISAELNPEEKAIIPSIYTTDIEAKLKLIVELGGKILKDKTPIDEKAEFGYYALFMDPNGNKMCLYSKV